MSNKTNNAIILQEFLRRGRLPAIAVARRLQMAKSLNGAIKYVDNLVARIAPGPTGYNENHF